ncbi:TetR/AcrR family transcriptional regulator [Amycolatopsis echigonensis]|uniref:TetR family transcriptional regulator n=1 Tax=Amycolatopsis echigonensis TaxID=2576905 RepID=A0A2N3WVE2_9PSEU|nr:MULTISPECIES: TetR family transcriptional regulator [Amycolatopsis]MBB2504780.1 TetR family transcriptional regulator [Amycolatopsis echigonensis]PKV97837.1 TetR family transcriptional regulator [Amycolatopsis niigatensis]
MTSTAPLGLRERKKRAARRALADAALRIALERGLDQLRVEDIASEVGVSPRTFNNYFSSKEEAVCAFIVERQERVREALLARPADEPLWDAVVNASLTRFAEEDRPNREDVRRVRAMMKNGGLFGEMLRAYATVERVLADAIAERAGDHANPLHARLMAGIVQNASRIAFETWLNSDSDDEEFVSIFTGLLREAAAGMPALAASGAAR